MDIRFKGITHLQAADALTLVKRTDWAQMIVHKKVLSAAGFSPDRRQSVIVDGEDFRKFAADTFHVQVDPALLDVSPAQVFSNPQLRVRINQIQTELVGQLSARQMTREDFEGKVFDYYMTRKQDDGTDATGKPIREA